MGKADALFGLLLLRGCRLPKQHNGFVLKYTIPSSFLLPVFGKRHKDYFGLKDLPKPTGTKPDTFLMEFFWNEAQTFRAAMFSFNIRD